MQRFLFIALILFGFKVRAQDSTIINRWKRAVVNFELRTVDTTGYAQFDADRKKNDKRLHLLLKSKRITIDQLLDSAMKFELSRPTTYRFSSGTGLFIIKDDKRYLLTAKHVIHDPVAASFRARYKIDSVYDQHLLMPDIFIRPNFDRMFEDTTHYYSKTITSTYNVKATTQKGKLTKMDSSRVDEEVISKVKTFGVSAFGVIDGTSVPCLPYTFSDELFDLAILSLDSKAAFYGGPQKFKNLADFLLAEGYQPIPYSDISTQLPLEGSEVFTVGFPGATSLIQKRTLTRDEITFAAVYNTLPVFAFGRVAMRSEHLPFFWTDMSVYPGNSGGPVIQSNRLVGIVSKQAIVDSTRIPYGLIVSSKYVSSLLEQQERKDRCHEIRD